MAFYEHVLIARQDISPQQVEALNEELKALIEDHGGHIAKIEYWGLRNLTYRIKKNRKGHYSLLAIDAPAAGGQGDGAPAVASTKTCCATSPSASTSSTWSSRRSWPAATANATANAATTSTTSRSERARAIMTDETAPDAAAAAGGPRRPFFRRRKVCPFSGANAPKIDYKDVKLLQRYISERGKIVPAASPRSRPRSSASWPRPSSAPASWRCCPTS